MLALTKKIAPESRAANDALHLTVLGTDGDLLRRLQTGAALRGFRERIEFIWLRKASRLPAPKGISALEYSRWALNGPRFHAELLNEGARAGGGEFLLFADLSDGTQVEAEIKQFLGEEMPPDILLRAGGSFLVKKADFLKVGGFDPRYFRQSFGEFEFLHRLMPSFDPALRRNQSLLRRFWRGPRIAKGGIALFGSQYGENSFHRFFRAYREPSVLPVSLRTKKILADRERLRERERLHLGIYRANPAASVRVYANIAALWWRKLTGLSAPSPANPAGKLAVLLTNSGIVPSVIRLVFRLSAAAQFLFYGLGLDYVALFLHQVAHAAKILYCKRRHLLLPVDLVKLHYWRIGYVYHFAKKHLWQTKRVLYFFRALGHFLKFHVWKLKRIYHFLFWLFFPLRKVYYVASFQFRKRILRVPV